MALALNKCGLNQRDVSALYHDRYGLSTITLAKTLPLLNETGPITNSDILSLFHKFKLNEYEITRATIANLKRTKGRKGHKHKSDKYWNVFVGVCDVLDGRLCQFLWFFQRNLISVPKRSGLRIELEEIYREYESWTVERELNLLPIESLAILMPYDKREKALLNHEWLRPDREAS